MYNSPIKEYIHLIEAQANKGEVVLWTEKVYKEVAEQISYTSKIYISTQTLKRLLGKIKTYGETYNPQEATKDAIAIYLGYENWTSISDSLAIKVSNNVIRTPKTENPTFELTGIKNQWLFFYLFIFLMVIISILVFFGAKEGLLSKSKPTLTWLNPQNMAPALGVFEYDAGVFAEDKKPLNYSVLFYSHDRVLDQGQNKFEHEFKTPDYYYLFFSSYNFLATSYVYLRYPFWKAYFSNEFQFEELDSSSFYNNNFLQADTQKLKDFDNYGNCKNWISYRVSRPLFADVNEMTLMAKIKNDEKLGASKNGEWLLRMNGELQPLQIHFCRPGSVNQIKLARDVKESKNDNVVYIQEYDMANWTDLKLQSQNDSLYIFINNKLITQIKQNLIVGELKSLAFIFRGNGAIKDIKVFNSKHEITYESDF